MLVDEMYVVKFIYF